MSKFKYLLFSIVLIPESLYATSKQSFVFPNQILYRPQVNTQNNIRNNFQINSQINSQSNFQNNIYNSILNYNYSMCHNDKFWEYLLILTLGSDISNLVVTDELPKPIQNKIKNDLFRNKMFDQLLKEVKNRVLFKMGNEAQKKNGDCLKYNGFRRAYSSLFSDAYRTNDYKPEKVSGAAITAVLKVTMSNSKTKLSENDCYTLEYEFLNIARSLYLLAENKCSFMYATNTCNAIDKFLSDTHYNTKFYETFNGICQEFLKALMLYKTLSQSKIYCIDENLQVCEVDLTQEASVTLNNTKLSLAECVNYTIARLKHNIVESVKNLLATMAEIVYRPNSFSVGEKHECLPALKKTLSKKVEFVFGKEIVKDIYYQYPWNILDKSRNKTYKTAGEYIQEILLPQLNRIIDFLNTYSNNSNFVNAQHNANIINISFGRNLMNAKPLAPSNSFKQENNKKGENILIDLNNNISYDIKNLTLTPFLCSRQEISTVENFMIGNKGKHEKVADGEIDKFKKDNKEKLKVEKTNSFFYYAEDEISAKGEQYVKNTMSMLFGDEEINDGEKKPSDNFFTKQTKNKDI